MKRFLQLTILVVAAGLGLSFGYLWRGDAPANPDTSEDTLVLTTTNFQPPPRVPLEATGSPVRPASLLPLPVQLEQDLSMSTGVTRWLYWLEAIDKAQPDDFPHLVRLAKDNSAALGFVAARWVELHPRHLFDHIVATEGKTSGSETRQLMSHLFKEWARRDPEAAIEALNETESLGNLFHSRLTVAMTVIDQDPERGLQLLSQWHIDSIGMGKKSMTKWAAADPRHAAEFTLEYPAGYASEISMKAIGEEWAKTDPTAALAFAADHPGRLGTELAEATMETWTEQDLDQATDWMAAADDLTRNRLSDVFVEALAKQDIDSALVWSASHLTGTTLAEAVGGAVKGVAENDVTAAAQLVADLNPSPARAEAAKAVGRKWFPQSFRDEPVPPEAVTWLEGLDSESMKKVLNEVQWGWVANSPETLAEFLVSAEPDAVPSFTDRSVARQLARDDPSKALAWSERLPAERARKAGSEAFSTWRSAQPEAAMQWLYELPETDTRRTSYFRKAIESMVHHPQAEQQLAAMRGQERDAARRVIEGMKLPDSHRTRLLQATH